MHSIIYNDYVSYDMKSYFCKQPKDMIRCPMCRGNLTKSEIDVSKPVARDLSESSLHPHHDFSCLFICNTCHWWYIRESWALLASCWWDYDYIATGIAKKWDLSAKKTIFTALKEHIKRERKSLTPKMLDVETVKNMIAKHTKSGCRFCDIRHIGTSNDADSNRRDVYLIEDDTAWLVLIKHAFDGSFGAVEAIDILNGVLISDEQPTGMIVTTTDLLVENGMEASVKGFNRKLFDENFEKPRISDTIKDYFRDLRRIVRRTYRIQLLDDSFDLKSFEKKAAEQTAPCLKALDDECLYANELILPEVYGSMFEEGQSKR